MTEEAVSNTLLVQNFGLRWRRDHAKFGRPGRGGQGSLNGFDVSAKQADRQKVDFWRQTGVYALYDGPELVYIGRATKGEEPLGVRLAYHNRDPKKSDRWTAFSWLGFRRINKDGSLHATSLPQRQINTEEAAKVLEGTLIELLNPRLNNRGGDLGHIPQYAQWRSYFDQEC